MGAIAIVHIETHDEEKPAGTRARSLGDDDIREFKRTVRERLAIDHEFMADETGEIAVGCHKKITFAEIQGSDPTTYTNIGYLYLKDVSAVVELFWKDESGNAIQITTGGKILGDNVQLSNNTNLKAKDAAGTGTVNLIKANASDKVEIPDGAVLATSGAPTVDAGIANKKYTDDKFNTSTGHDHDGSDSKLLTGLGAWVATNVTGTNYQAATDGFVLAYTNELAADPSSIIGYSDATATPTTIRSKFYNASSYGNAANTVMFPVKKSDYWRVDVVAYTATVLWIPLGV